MQAIVKAQPNEHPYARKASYCTLPAKLPLLLDVSQAAQITGMSENSMRTACRKNTIKAAQVGNKWRINRDALLEQFGLAEVG